MRKRGIEFNLQVLVTIVLALLLLIVILSFLSGGVRDIVLAKLPRLDDIFAGQIGYGD